MWGRRRKRGGRLPKQLALGMLEDAMGQVQPPEELETDQHEPGEQEAGQPAPYPGAVPPQAGAPDRRAPEQDGLSPADVPVDNAAAPPAADAVPPKQRQRGTERAAKSTRHGSLG